LRRPKIVESVSNEYRKVHPDFVSLSFPRRNFLIARYEYYAHIFAIPSLEGYSTVCV
jgi:hypothetical protein